MSIQVYKSIKITDMQKTHTHLYGDKYHTVETNTRTTFDLNDIYEHSIKLSLLKEIFTPNIRLLLSHIKKLLIYSSIGNIIGSALFLAFSHDIKKYLPIFVIKGHFLLTIYANAFPYTFVLFVIFLYPAYLKSKISFKIKRTCYSQRGFDNAFFDEDVFDRNYKVIKESEWDSFKRTLI